METHYNSNTAEGIGAGGTDCGAELAAIGNGAGSIEFDASSGISESEQRDILAGIENITVKNRISLSGEQGLLATGTIAAKRGGLAFPLIVNIAALLLLAAAFFILYAFHNKDEAEIREGNAVYNSAERALIREIRRETARELEEKETEISLIASKLTGVDAELQELYSNNQELTAEQRAIEQNLHRLQEEYRGSLGLLQNERSQILEASRAREASLHAQLEERTSELSAVSEQNNAARAELERLSGDQEKAAAIEAQLSARYATAAAQIFTDKLSDAGGSLAKMREFLDTPSFQNVRTFRTRKELYLASIDSLEKMINKTNETEHALAEGNASIGEYEKQVAGLDEKVAGLNRDMAAYASQGAELSRQIREYESRTAALQDQLSGQQQILAERNNAVTNLQSENTALIRRVTERDTTITDLNGRITAQEADIARLNGDLTTLRQAVQALQALTQ
jgi:chromosome segregation ATPase